jgi:hypothetical protein
MLTGIGQVLTSSHTSNNSSRQKHAPKRNHDQPTMRCALQKIVVLQWSAAIGALPSAQHDPVSGLQATVNEGTRVGELAAVREHEPLRLGPYGSRIPQLLSQVLNRHPINNLQVKACS